MLTIDGSFGEGGGQILRSALALSIVTGRSFRIENVRAGRKKPGLMRQHLTAVQAAVKIGNAAVDGAAIGSTALVFQPTQVTPGQYRFAIGTAGSATLVLQTVLPALLCASQASKLTFEGGTHNPYAPPFDFLVNAFLPLVNRMGPSVSATLQRPGFYPAGGGRFHVTIEPTGRLRGFDLPERGKIRRRCATAMIAKLPRHIAQRELRVVAQELDWEPRCLHIDEIKDSASPGNVVMLVIESEHVTEVFTSFGQRGVPAEAVAGQAAKAIKRYLKADVPVGEFLADQLLLPLAIAGSGSFKTFPLSQHAVTHIELIRSFLDTKITVEESSAEQCLVHVG